jgi:signal transduction histidine kinase
MYKAVDCPETCRLAHVLRNKLATIVGTRELLSQQSATNPETLARMQHISDAAKAMADAINKPLSLSQGG